MPNNTMQLDWPACVTKGLDRRTRRTREALMRALLALLQEKPLNSVTVTELAQMADVNRATFYTHYQDIFDMFDHLKHDLCQTCRQMVDSHGAELAQGEYGGLITDIYQFLGQNEGLFTVVFSDDADSAFFTSLIEVVREACLHTVGVQQSVGGGLKSKGVGSVKAKQVSQIVCNYQFDYIAGGVVSILRNWMLGGRKESVEQMANITNACIKCLNPDGKYSYSVDSAIEFMQG
jgi:hypothetical protein